MILVPRNLPEHKEKPFRKIRVFRTTRESRAGSELCFHRAPANLCETATKTQQCVPKNGAKMTLNLPATGNWGGVVNLRAQRAPGNWCEVMTVKLKGQGSNFTQCKSPTLGTLRKSSKELAAKIESRRKRHQCLVLKLWRPMYSIWGSFVSTTMQAAVHLGANCNESLELHRNTNFEELQNLFDIT